MSNWEIVRFVNFVRSIDKVRARPVERVPLKQLRNAKKHLVRTKKKCTEEIIWKTYIHIGRSY